MVTVVDSIMGSGKTSWAIQYMNDNPEKSFLYITPFLKEIERIEKVSSIEIFQPNNSNGNRKLNNLNDLLAIGKNIGATHELFKHLNNESLKLIRDNNYILIMDEALDVVVPLNIFKTDVELLISNGDLTISDKGYAIWSGDEDYKGRFKDIKNAAKKHQLICVNNSILYWQYPPEVFECFNSVYVMTYMFETSILSGYFKIYSIKYKTVSVKKENNKYFLVKHCKEDKNNIKSLIDIYEGNLNNHKRQKSVKYSKQWFSSKASSEEMKKLKNNLYNYFHHISKSKCDDTMWTTFKDYAPKICSKGFTYKKDGKNKTFVSCNARATNEFGGKHYLGYCVNMYMNPLISTYFTKIGQLNGVKNVKINQDEYSLSQVVQWIWRSAIRNGEKIHIYIPSKRVHDILKEWIEN